eukprot:CAMPEP_0202685618 /NCGR_PEP_ID=MMETSP1385-20130828/1426_1 /ASSEMBLY_ACC=CAM_ASM_000861 /TAXON_ID=933848 /ORGANISM="Elphidium margaritaceum" /LENGTH=49 /DNA_ID= /DNA_START= /DNA_END= /DNA_ORIENTATION=
MQTTAYPPQDVPEYEETMAMTATPTQTTTNGEFGESEYGERLNYAKPKY